MNAAQRVGRVLLRRGLGAVRALVEAGKLPAEALAILGYAREYEASAVSHVAGEPTLVEQRAIATAVTAGSLAALFLAQAAREGFYIRDPKLGASVPHPLLEAAGVASDREARALAVLPKARRTREVGFVEGILADQAAAEGANAEAAGAPLPVPPVDAPGGGS